MKVEWAIRQQGVTVKRSYVSAVTFVQELPFLVRALMTVIEARRWRKGDRPHQGWDRITLTFER